MTVKELIAQLQERDPDALVYVPWSEGKNGIAEFVCRCPHKDQPQGITISDDVAILPMQMGDFVHGQGHDS